MTPASEPSLFDVLYEANEASRKSHMMALALEQLFAYAVPPKPCGCLEGAAGEYLLVTPEDRKLLSFLVSEVETCTRLAFAHVEKLESDSRLAVAK